MLKKIMKKGNVRVEIGKVDIFKEHRDRLRMLLNVVVNGGGGGDGDEGGGAVVVLEEDSKSRISSTSDQENISSETVCMDYV